MTKYLALVFLFVTMAAQADVEQQFAEIGDLELLSGGILRDVRIGYVTAGELNEDRSNIVVFPTWVTGTAANLVNFGVVGPGKLADTDHYYVVMIDALGNGVSTSPSNSQSQAGAEFPAITIGDMVNSQHRLLTGHLGLEHVHAVMGISMGGMQTFDWIGRYSDYMDRAIPIAGSPRMTSYDLLQWRTHKRVIGIMQEAGHPEKGISATVSALSQLTLQTPAWFVENVRPEDLESFLGSGSFMFSSHNYVAQLNAMIEQNVFGNTEESHNAYLDRVIADVLVIGGIRDHMVNQVPAQKAAAELDAELFMLDSICGHLTNVCEYDAVSARVSEFLR